jgi:hypothetical protein
MADFAGMTLDPAVLASLQNTLTPEMKVLSAFQADQERQARLAAQRTSQATEAAASAGQQYQTAAAAPPPQLDPLSASLPLLLGNISSIIGGDQAAPQRAQMGIAEQRRSLMQARTDNLIALKDNFDKKARAAEAAGDNEAATKARMQIETLSKTLDVLHQQEQHKQATDLEGKRQQGAKELEGLRQKGDIAAIRVRGEEQRKTDAAQAAAQANIDLADYIQVRTLPDGTKVPLADITGIPDKKRQGAVDAAARQSGVKVLSKAGAESLPLLDSVRSDMQYITENTIPLLPSGKVLNRMKGAGVNRIEAMLQTPGKGAQLAAYPATRTAAIKTIQALASLGHGLRINQAEIKAAQEFDYPRITDSQETALEKFKILNMMLDHIEGAIAGKPPTNEEVRALLKAAAALKRGEKAPKVGGDPLRIR